MPRLTTSRPRSGSMIWARAERTCCWLGIGMAPPILRGSRARSPAPSRLAGDLDALQLHPAGVQGQDADRALPGEPGGRGGGHVDEAGASDRLVAPAVRVTVDADVQPGRRGLPTAR